MFSVPGEGAVMDPLSAYTTRGPEVWRDGRGWHLRWPRLRVVVLPAEDGFEIGQFAADGPWKRPEVEHVVTSWLTRIQLP